MKKSRAPSGTVVARFMRAWPAWLVLVVGLTTTVAATGLLRDDAVASEGQRLQDAADDVTIEIQERLDSYELVLRGAAGLFEGSDGVTRNEWASYVTTVDAQRIATGLQGVGYATIVPKPELPTHEALVRAEGFPDYQVHPGGDRDLYTSVLYIEPFSGRNLRAFGYDMYTNPVRRAAMNQARDTGEPAMTGRVTLIQETRTDVQTGALLIAPVYRRGAPLSSVLERRDAIIGWTFIPLRMTDFIESVFAKWAPDRFGPFTLRAYQSESTAPTDRLFTSGDSADSIVGPGELQRAVHFYGRTWTLQFDHAPGTGGADLRLAWATLIGGLVATGLLVALLLSWRSSGRRAVAIADELTVDLRRRDAALEQSEYRWKFAVEGAGDGLWDWDVRAGRNWYSHQWKAMLGLTDDEIGSGLAEWSSRIHPEDLAATTEAVNAYLRGETDRYEHAYRMQCKDGTYRWILGRGMVVERDPDGQPLRVIGTNRDITEQKRLEHELIRRSDQLEMAQRIAKVGSWSLRPSTGEVEWSPALYDMFGMPTDAPAPAYEEQSRLFTEESWDRLRPAVEACVTAGTPYELELEVITRTGVHRWMLARGVAIRDERGAIEELRGIALDVTDRRSAVHRIAHLTQLYRALSECNAALIHETDQQDLFQRLCDVVVRYGDVAMTWIGVVDPVTRMLVPVASAGSGTEYVDGLEVSIDADDPRSWGPAGTAARAGRAVWLEDFAADPLTAPWRDRAAKYGWASTACLPLRQGGQTVAVLALYSAEHGWLDRETQSLLESLADDISFALDKAQTAAQLEEAEHRFQSLVEQSIAGAFIIQDDVIAYANPRCKEILGYDEDDDLVGVPATSFFTPEDADDAIDQWMRAEARRGGGHENTFRAIRKDGTYVTISAHSAFASYHQRPAVIGMMQDLGDRKIAEEQIEHYVAQIEKVMFQTVGVITDLSEMRDPYTAGHEHGVARLAVEIGRRMGLDEHRLEGLRVGGLLHDVGKIAVPAEILVKPSRLTPLELSLVREHPQVGYDLLKNIDFPWPVARIAHEHHEHIDGSGYPSGLRGDEICLEARIISVADVVDSMSSHRPYRPALGVDAAIQEIERNAGTFYDPDAVRACVEHLAG